TLFGLLGAAGAAVAPLAGRLADRRDPRVTVSYSVALTILAFLWLAPLNGSLWALIIGIVLLDLGVQSGQISNQSRIYALRPGARARLNTVYMGSYFIGGSLGAGIGSWSWGHWDWTGVTITGLAFLTVAAVVHLYSLRKNPMARKLA
ncbi:MAG: MFS transporter, partial [Firmicutes bacterium]|nr:MFS transporter [Bacillota bacterium]